MVNLSNLLTYDIESYPNIFTLVGKHEPTSSWVRFEISERVDNIKEFGDFLVALRDNNVAMVGYNNIGFDYPVIHYFMQNYHKRIGYRGLYEKTQAIIDCDDRFEHCVRPKQVIIPQVDLYKVHHFDNMARATSLKTLEFNMGSESIEDLPYEPGVPVPGEGFPQLLDYNAWDVEQTSRFLKHSTHALEFRNTMSELLGKDCTNSNDVKIGKEVFVNRLEAKNPGICYDKYTPRQTPRASIALGDVILPYIKFEHPEFNRIKDWLSEQVITETKGTFKGLDCTVDGFKYVFGLGGIHGSVSSTIVKACEEFAIIDYDVTSYYPSLSIVNGLYPEHLGMHFCNVYDELFHERKKHKKGTPENAAFKLALNGTYGASNDKYSPFYDPKFTMAITINGQLSLCMLAEQLIKIPNCSVIQVNTDGLTIKIPRKYSDGADSLVKWWEGVTALNMERADYSTMAIRDVNNYIAVGTDGKVKRKGCYAYGDDLGWHQNHSNQVVAKIAERVLLEGVDTLTCLMMHPDKHDFLLCTKVPRSSELHYGGHKVQNICRYTVTREGEGLTKIMPPLKSGKPFATYLLNKYGQGGQYNEAEEFGLFKNDVGNWRRFAINKGYKVSICNRLSDFNSDFNYQFYIEEINKITSPLMH